MENCHSLRRQHPHHPAGGRPGGNPLHDGKNAGLPYAPAGMPQWTWTRTTLTPMSTEMGSAMARTAATCRPPKGGARSAWPHGPVSLLGHRPLSGRMNQGRNDRHRHLDIAVQGLCAGFDRSGLHALQTVSRKAGTCRDRHHRVDGAVLATDANASCHVRAWCHDGKTVVVEPSLTSKPARGANQAEGGSFSTRTRVTGTCNRTPVNRKRITQERHELRNRES